VVVAGETSHARRYKWGKWELKRRRRRAEEGRTVSKS
jgi:hypothetical protein